MITKKHLIQLGVPPDKAAEYEGPLISVMSKNGISTPQRAAAFVAQLVHESSGFRTVAENFNYTPAALMATFNTRTKIRFSRLLAEQFGRTVEHPANKPMIAMIAYANRMGNGDVDSGDGWRYSGKGPLQITGRDNYKAAGEAIGVDLIAAPESLLDPLIGTMAAGWFWSKGNSTGKSLNSLADAWQIKSISRIVNGGDNGMEHRLLLSEQTLRVLS